MPIFYESRLAKLDVKQAEIDALNARWTRSLRDEERWLFARSQSGTGRAGEGWCAAPRLQQVTRDTVEHFEARVSVIDSRNHGSFA